MGALAVIIAVCSLAQTLDDRVYKVDVEGEKKPLYGHIDEKSLEAGSTELLVVLLDEPWTDTPRVRTLPRGKAKWLPEWSGDRPARLEAEAAAAGFKLAKNGRYYPLEEVQLADRAREMAGWTNADQTAPATPDAAEAAELPQDAPPAVAPPERGFLARWGIEILLVAGALALSAVVIKFIVLSG